MRISPYWEISGDFQRLIRSTVPSHASQHQNGRCGPSRREGRRAVEALAASSPRSSQFKLKTDRILSRSGTLAKASRNVREWGDCRWGSGIRNPTFPHRMLAWGTWKAHFSSKTFWSHGEECSGATEQGPSLCGIWANGPWFWVPGGPPAGLEWGKFLGRRGGHALHLVHFYKTRPGCRATSWICEDNAHSPSVRDQGKEVGTGSLKLSKGFWRCWPVLEMAMPVTLLSA